MQAEFIFAQKEEQEHALSSHKSDITFIKKSFENFDLKDDAKALPECSDLEDHQDRFANQDDDDCFYVKNTRNGERFQTRESQDRNQGRTLRKTVKFQLTSRSI
jgi:hypothetical protein